MASTHLSLHCHLIFSTKSRYPFITIDIRDRVHQYLGGCVRAVDAIPEIVGGVTDHVHLLIGLRATHRLADVVRDIKKPSTEWIRDTLGVPKFAWQEGYGAFSVSFSAREQVKRYIEHQEEHHRRRTFQEEYLEFLGRHEVEYDEKYLW